MQIPIQTLQLLDLQLPNEPGTKKLFLIGAKQLLEEHPKAVKQAGADIELFHNKAIVYSSIQLDRKKGNPLWTAVGQDAINTLQCWYQIFWQQNPHLVKNTLETTEQYTPEFLNYQQGYRIRPMLISDNLAKELNVMDDHVDRLDRLEKYLYGNLQTYLRYIGFEYDKNEHFLKTNVIKSDYYSRPLEVYHQQKKTALEVLWLCNFRLPQTLRLGQSTALGYGRVSHL